MILIVLLVLSSKMATLLERKAEFSKPTKASRLLRSYISTNWSGAPKSRCCLSLSGSVDNILKPLLVASAMQVLSQLKLTVLMISMGSVPKYCSSW